MTVEYSLALTIEQGQMLLQTANVFGMPEKLGDTTFSTAERRAANKDVQRLYSALRAKSPLLIAKRRVCFGPKEAWEEALESTPQGPVPTWKIKDQVVNGTLWIHQEVPLKFDQYILSGARWCLLICQHPASPILKPASTQEEIIEPLASRLRATKWLEKQTGLDKADRKVVELDGAQDDISGLKEIKEIEEGKAG